MASIHKFTCTQRLCATALKKSCNPIWAACFTSLFLGLLFCGITRADDAEVQPEELTLQPSTHFLNSPTSSLNVRPVDGMLPENQAAEILADEQNHAELLSPEFRAWGRINYLWKAPVVAYRPLYFEDEQLERYGRHHGCLQPVVSAGHFFGRMTAFPYMMGATPCDECQYPLGYYRPGDCVPEHCTRPKTSARGAIYQAIAITGGIFVIP